MTKQKATIGGKTSNRAGYADVGQGLEKLDEIRFIRGACTYAITPVGGLPTLTKMRVRVGKVKAKNQTILIFPYAWQKCFLSKFRQKTTLYWLDKMKSCHYSARNLSQDVPFALLFTVEAGCQ